MSTRKQILHADFKFRYTYQYYSSRNGKYSPTGSKYGPYSGLVPRLYLEGDENTIWRDILLKLGESKTKRFNIVEKEIINVRDVGKTVK